MESLIMFPVFWIVGFMLFKFSLFQLKHVKIDSLDIYVSNSKDYVTIPLDNILTASGSSMQNPEIITIKLRHPTVFGSTIKFMPDVRFNRISSHPTLQFLKELIR